MILVITLSAMADSPSALDMPQAASLFTRKDSGNETFNLSEIIGAGAAAGIGNAYYPSQQNRFVKTYQRWISQLIQDAAGNLAKEFWPDINRALFHGKY